MTPAEMAKAYADGFDGVFAEVAYAAFLCGYTAKCSTETQKPTEESVKWLVDDDYHELSEKGRFILGSVGLGYNGYYIPYSDLLKLPKED